MALQVRHQGRLEPAETEAEIRLQAAQGGIAGADPPLREDHAGARSGGAPCSLLQHRAARIAESQQLGRLVECFAGGIVQRLSQYPAAPVGRDVHERRVSAGNHQRQQRQNLCRIGSLRSEKDTVDVRLDVIDADQRLAERPGQPLGRRKADQQRAGQAGAVGDRDRIDLRPAEMRTRQRLADHAGQLLDMAAGGDLRHDSAVGLVQRHLAEDDRSQHLATAADDGGGRLVAGGLDAEHRHLTSRLAPKIRAATNASIARSSWVSTASANSSRRSGG